MAMRCSACRTASRAGRAQRARVVLRARLSADSRVRLAGQERLPPFGDDPSLLLDERGVLPQRAPDLEVLTLDDSLRAGNLARHDRIRRPGRTWRRGRCAAGISDITP